MKTDFLTGVSKILKERNLGALLISPSAEMKFIIGSSPMLCERFQGMFVTAEGKYFYVSNELTKNELTHILPGAPLYTWMDGEDFTNCIAKAFDDFGLCGTKIAVNSAVQGFNILTMAEKLNATFTNGRDILEEMRIIKTNDELQALRDSAALTDKVYLELLNFIKEGMTETQVNDILIDLYAKNGIQGSHGGIVAAGPNGALPHHFGGETVIKKYDSLVLDFGCMYNGMMSDMTRTVFIGGATDKQKEVYDIVLKSNLAGEAASKLGAFIPDIEHAAREVIEKAGYGKYFVHRLGHGIGCFGHEAPYILMNNERHLEKGMAFSIEPGIYLPNEFGVRIEDIVFINHDGETEVINTTSKELTII